MSALNADLCRTCLGNKDGSLLESIFKIKDFSTSITIAEIINTSISSSVHITQNDGYSDKICIGCSQKVLEFHKFKLHIEKNELILKSGMCVQHSEDSLKQKLLMEDNLFLVDIKQEIKEESVDEDEYKIHTCEIINTDDGVMEEEPFTEVIIKNETVWPLNQEELHHEVIIEDFKQKEENFNSLDIDTEFSNTPQCDETSSHNKLKKQKANRPFECEICNKTFVQRFDLKRHLVNHSGEKMFECRICNMKFVQRFDLKRHLMIHTGEKPFECEHCHLKFTRKYNLDIHLLIHSGKKEFECDHCSKKFLTRKILNRHLLIHNEKQFECEYCHKKLIRKDSLANHLLIHKGEKQFECYSCQKKFRIKAELKSHLLSNSCKKEIECDICNIKFAKKNELSKHLLMHTDVKSYQCEHCHKMFTRENYYQRHLLKHKELNQFIHKTSFSSK